MFAAGPDIAITTSLTYPSCLCVAIAMPNGCNLNSSIGIFFIINAAICPASCKNIDNNIISIYAALSMSTSAARTTKKSGFTVTLPIILHIYVKQRIKICFILKYGEVQVRPRCKPRIARKRYLLPSIHLFGFTHRYPLKMTVIG